MAGRRDLNLVWLVVALMATACAPGSAQPESAPTEAPSGPGQSEHTAPSLVLSPGATSGGRLYQTWPLMMVLSIRMLEVL